ncbi:MAG: 3-phosphoshikimate 1-carboxyvinyltransferase [Actinomycetota bacterium]
MGSALAIEPLIARPDVTVAVPGSKSHTNRALACAALADGRSQLDGALFAEDTWAMINALGNLGLDVDANPDRVEIVVDGCGGALPAGPRRLDVAQSGTTGRFLLATLALGEGPYVLDGDEQLRARPFGPLVHALRTLGASIDGDRLPLTVNGGAGGGRVELGGSVSSQFLSGLLMAAPCAATAGADVVIELTDELVSVPYVALTLATMATFGVDVDHSADHQRFRVPAQRYRATDAAIEPDASAASYFFAAAAITGGRVRIPGLSAATVQGDLRFVDILAEMGAEVTYEPDAVTVVGRELRGVTVDMRDCSDVAQTLAMVATFASEPTTITGIGFIRHKETDRVSAVVDELTKLGITAVSDADGFTVHPGVPTPGAVATYRDHRMAMSFALLGLVHPGIVIEDPDCVAKTFPDYFSVLDRLRR